MKSETCCFTGHRQIPLENQAEIIRRLEHAITDLYHKGVNRFEAGGALGFDTLAARTVLRLRKKYPNIKLILVLPCLTQTRGWTPGDIAEYEQIREQADEVIYTSQEYIRGCMHKRNRRLVDDSSICICCLTKSSGGTAYTVNYAKKKGLKITNIAPSTHFSGTLQK